LNEANRGMGEEGAGVWLSALIIIAGMTSHAAPSTKQIFSYLGQCIIDFC
jgi:hypothetical protein